MRLHLPTTLRVALKKVLLAASLISTLGTIPAYGTLDFSYDSTTKVLTVSSPSTVAVSVINSDITANTNYSTAEKLILNLSNPGSTNVYFTTATINKNIQIGADGSTDKGLRLNNGNNNTVLTLSGTITGSGIISMAGGGGNPNGKRIIFTGDFTGFAGTINLNTTNSGKGYIRFGSGAAATGTESSGVAGNCSIAMTSSSNDFVEFNYAAGTDAYVTNTFTGTGTIINIGAANLILKNSLTSNMTLAGDSTSSGSFILNGGVSTSITLTLTNASLDHSSQTTALSLAGISLLSGTNNLYGNYTLSGDISGGNATISTINIGNTTGKTANVTAANFYGHYQNATATSNSTSNNITTVNVNSGSTLNVTTLLQIARDGKGILNINNGGTVVTNRFDMGTNLGNNWVGTPSDGKQAILNLNGGTLIIGSAGITQEKNLASSPGVLNLYSGTLGGSSSWSTSLAATFGSSSSDILTVNTGTYNSTNKSFDSTALTITLGSITTATGSTLNLQGGGTLTVGANSALQNVTFTQGNSNLTLGSNSSLLSLSVGKNIAATVTVGDGFSLQSDAAVTLNEGSTLTYNSSANTLGVLDLTSKAVTLNMTSANVSSSTSTVTAMIKAESVTLTGSTTTLNLSNEELVSLLKNIKSGEKQAKLAVTSGTLTFSDESAYKKQLLGSSDILTELGFAITGVEGGNILLNGDLVDTSDIYVVTNGDESFPESITSYRSLDPYKAVVLDDNETLSVSLNGEPTNGESGLIVRNLVGATGSALNVTNTGNTTAVVLLDNTSLADGTEEPVTSTPVGTDTSMDGSLSSSGSVVFLKQGAGILTVNGSVDTDIIQVEQGGLVLNGNSVIKSLVLAGNTTNKSKVDINGTTQTTLCERDDLNNMVGNGSDLTLGQAGVLNLTGENTLAKSSISGSGTVTLDSAGSLEMSDTASLSGVALQVDGEVTLNGSDSSLYSISSLNGEGYIELAATDGGTLTVNGTGTSTFSGAIGGTGTLILQNGTANLLNSGNKDLALKIDNAMVTLDGSGAIAVFDADSTSGLQYSGATISNGGTLTLGTVSNADQTLNLGSNGLSINGGTLNIQISMDTESAFVAATPLVTTTGAITLSSGTVNLLNDNTLVAAENENLRVTLMTGGSAATVNSAVSFISSFLSSVYDDLILIADGNNVVLTGVAKNDNIFSTGDLSPNAQAGADLLWGARFSLKDDTSVLKEAYLGVFNQLEAGDMTAASKTMAAIAGSTINATGTAQRDALRSQLSLVRDCTTQMGVNPAYVNADLPYFHLWLEGTGSSAKLNTDGDEGGYKLNTWGGTVGMDVDLSDRLTIGAALSANYGDLSASAAEVATGSLDSYYVSLFGRYQSKRWAHTLILTGGWNNADLNRTVHYGSGSYSTQGSTNGYGIGAMYEVTYDVALNESKSSILQPLANLSVVHTGLDAYTESGAGNAGLNVGKQEWTTATVALGARWLGLVGSNIFGREALAELRVNAAQDMGDSQGKTDVSLIGKSGFTQTVRGAKVGTTALQVGAGLSIPVGIKGTVYCNGNADIRSGSSALNATLGFRYNF